MERKKQKRKHRNEIIPSFSGGFIGRTIPLPLKDGMDKMPPKRHNAPDKAGIWNKLHLVFADLFGDNYSASVKKRVEDVAIDLNNFDRTAQARRI